MRVYIPATLGILRRLVEDRQIHPVSGTAFAVTPSLREAYSSGGDDELSYVAMSEAARASLRLLAIEAAGGPAAPSVAAPDAAADTAGSMVPRRAVLSADVDGIPRPDLDEAVVRLSGPVVWDQIASVHIDLEQAESDVARAVEVIDEADLGDVDAEFVLGDVEDHQLAWYAPAELPFLLDMM